MTSTRGWRLVLAPRSAPAGSSQRRFAKRARQHRLRVLLSLPRLLAGEPVISVALSMGYDTPSAFITVFKREMGVTPARYAKGDGGN